MVRVKSSQKVFTEQEVTVLTGICVEHLRDVVRTKHLGFLQHGDSANQLFTSTDLMILAVLQPRCEH